MRHEIAALREFSPDVPVTTNMMGTFPGLNYWKMAPHLDVISWDSYPHVARADDVQLAVGDRLRPRHQPLPQGRQALHADGERPQRHQLDAVRQSEATRDARALVVAGRGARLRHGAVLPVAQESRLVGEVPRRGGGSRGAREHARLPRRRRSRREAGEACACGGHDRPPRCGHHLRLGEPVGDERRARSTSRRQGLPGRLQAPLPRVLGARHPGGHHRYGAGLEPATSS